MDNFNYGVIGNCRSAALVSEKGSLDWCCLPDFTSPSVFAKILDTEKGGSFCLEVSDGYKIHQSYLHNTNILITRYSKGDDCFELIDFMPRYKSGGRQYHYPPDIIRYINYISGKPEVRIIYNPKLMYAKDETEIINSGEYIKAFTKTGVYESLYLYSDIDPDKIIKRESIVIEENHFFLISYNQKLFSFDIHKIHLEYERTKVYWLNWVDRTNSFKKHNEQIIRSALVLKLLTYQKTGAILAAVTTSLPEIIGGERNWDYRFCWIRDSSMIISILSNLGHINAARRFLNFIMDVIPYKARTMQIMYGIHGENDLEEKTLDWLSGYKGSKPVRIGNSAYLQKQNDIYGVLIDLIYKHFKMFRLTLSNSEELWTIVRSLVRTVRNEWMLPDKGIWEIRNTDKHFTFSKMLCWVALDRGIKIAELLGKTEIIPQWSKVRDEIKDNIIVNGWNSEVDAFTQAYDNTYMDASNLLMNSYGFIEADDPKYVSTVKRTKEELCVNGFMYRYKNQDDFGLPKSSFIVCTFWLIKSLFMIGEKDEARRMFNELSGCSNHLGLYSEGIDFSTKMLLGNFPQGYSHLAFIDTALTLSGMKISEEDEILNSILSSDF